jgi:hypothetical protein
MPKLNAEHDDAGISQKAALVAGKPEPDEVERRAGRLATSAFLRTSAFPLVAV